MSLKTTRMSQCLDKKTLIWGFEMADVLIVFLLLAVLNLLFGSTDQKLLLVWLPPFLLATILRYGKKGRPENYLIHWIRYQFSSGIYCAFKESKQAPLLPNFKSEVAI